MKRSIPDKHTAIRSSFGCGNAPSELRSFLTLCGAGLPFGRFAWKLRLNRWVHAVFRHLHSPGARHTGWGLQPLSLHTKSSPLEVAPVLLAGSVDLTFLSPPREPPHDVVGQQRLRNEGLWLHVDSNPLLPLGDAPMWQSALHVYATASSRAGGHRWERIAQVSATSHHIASHHSCIAASQHVTSHSNDSVAHRIAIRRPSASPLAPIASGGAR